MLSKEEIEIVKSTVGVLEEKGVELTRHFYRRMFEGDPQVRAFFNPAHQQSGGQQEALAAAICAYAKGIDDLESLLPAVEVIAHKHVSLQIKPEHYPIVGKHLLGSIQEVLDLPADHPAVKAWASAYQLLADVLISREQELYEAQLEAGGWEGFKPLKVIRKEAESETITSFYLQSEEGDLPRFLPGQYLTVRLPVPEPGHGTRNYSLSGSPDASTYRISVKREASPNGAVPPGTVSNYLHDRVEVGDTIDVAPPCGEFVLKEPTGGPLVLLSGGVGITPLLSMLHASLAAHPDRPVYFVHAARNSRVQAFRDELESLRTAHPNLTVHLIFNQPDPEDLKNGLCHSAGLITEALLRTLLPDSEGDYYFCGPKPFMAAVLAILDNMAVPEERTHFEFFGPRQDLKRPEVLKPAAIT